MLPKRSSPVPRDPRHVVVQVRVVESGLSFAALASRVTETSVAIATFVDLPSGAEVILDVVPSEGGAPITVRAVVAEPRDDEGSVLLTLHDAELARARFAAWVRATTAAANAATVARSS